ncbi:MAG: helix-turn-helix domain-containing protein [Myxococcota bacterium]|jgi:transcriptional regulator with XRE-family HTH domain|nr:helix-turn-helix domain-containing protein [Myxococcota bacterium]
MRLEQTATDTAILEELGKRLARRRLDLNLTQAELAHEAGVSKRTVERIEGGHSAQMASWLRVLRVLRMVDALEAAFPEPRPSPIELLEHKGKPRQRAARRSSKSQHAGEWKWGDEEG